MINSIYGFYIIEILHKVKAKTKIHVMIIPYQNVDFNKSSVLKEKYFILHRLYHRLQLLLRHVSHRLHK